MNMVRSVLGDTVKVCTLHTDTHTYARRRTVLFKWRVAAQWPQWGRELTG